MFVQVHLQYVLIPGLNCWLHLELDKRRGGPMLKFNEIQLLLLVYFLGSTLFSG